MAICPRLMTFVAGTVLFNMPLRACLALPTAEDKNLIA